MPKAVEWFVCVLIGFSYSMLVANAFLINHRIGLMAIGAAGLIGAVTIELDYIRKSLESRNDE